jgi:hypothetical protein
MTDIDPDRTLASLVEESPARARVPGEERGWYSVAFSGTIEPPSPQFIGPGTVSVLPDDGRDGVTALNGFVVVFPGVEFESELAGSTVVHLE